MSRPDKLAQQIASLERDYLSLLHEELLVEDAGSGTSNLFFIIYRGPVPRRPMDAVRFDRFEKLTRRITSLRRKAGVPVPGPVLSVIERFRREYDALATNQRPHIFRHFAREALREIESLRASDAAGVEVLPNG